MRCKSDTGEKDLAKELRTPCPAPPVSFPPPHNRPPPPTRTYAPKRLPPPPLYVLPLSLHNPDHTPLCASLPSEVPQALYKQGLGGQGRDMQHAATGAVRTSPVGDMLHVVVRTALVAEALPVEGLRHLTQLRSIEVAYG